MCEASVVIPTYGRADSLRRVLEACSRQTVPANAFEVIVAIDGGDPVTVAMLRAQKTPYRLRWVAHDKRSGPAAARNLGAGLSTGEILLFLDDDILLVPEGVEEHVAAHREGRSRVCLGQVRAIDEGRLTPWERYMNGRYEEHYDKLATPGYRPDYRDCMSGNLSVSRELYLASGGFDSGFAATRHDDIEFAFRLEKLGAEFVHRPNALGYHLFTKSADDGLRDAFANGASSVMLAQLHPDLWPHPAWERWQRYPRRAHAFFRWSLRAPSRIKAFASISRLTLLLAQQAPLPRPARRAILRTSYHLHFWLGVVSRGVPAFVFDSTRSGAPGPE